MGSRRASAVEPAVRRLRPTSGARTASEGSISTLCRAASARHLHRTRTAGSRVSRGASGVLGETGGSGRSAPIPRSTATATRATGSRVLAGQRPEGKPWQRERFTPLYVRRRTDNRRAAGARLACGPGASPRRRQATWTDGCREGTRADGWTQSASIGGRTTGIRTTGRFQRGRHAMRGRSDVRGRDTAEFGWAGYLDHLVDLGYDLDGGTETRSEASDEGGEQAIEAILGRCVQVGGRKFGSKEGDERSHCHR
jgi:hypothetical protein